MLGWIIDKIVRTWNKVNEMISIFDNLISSSKINLIRLNN